jgi:hypothetical protein
MAMRRRFGWLLVLGLLAVGSGRLQGQEAVRLQERFAAGYQYHVRARVDLSGTLTLPAGEGRPKPRQVSLRGDSALDYHERVLTVNAEGQVSKTLRICTRMDFRRTVAEQLQETSLRPAVRRLVLLRNGNTEVPFSPDGPLTWGEIDQVRTDVFTPALAGLLPATEVKVGEHWKATTDAIQELTDLEKIEDGSLECRLERIDTTAKGRQARIAFTGTVRGTNEDGPNRQKLTGYLLFDLATNHLSYLHLQGVHALLDADGKEVGRVEGQFVLQRSLDNRSPDLTDAAVKGVATEPNADNTRLLYDNPDLGVRFLYPRRWRVVGVRGSQVILDGSDKSGLLLTLDPLERVPTGGQFLAESRTWLEKQKAKVSRVVPPRRLRESPPLDHFAIEAEMGEQKIWMDYFVVRYPVGGATLAARLVPGELETVRKEAELLARSIGITKPIEAKKK